MLGTKMETLCAQIRRTLQYQNPQESFPTSDITLKITVSPNLTVSLILLCSGQRASQSKSQRHKLQVGPRGCKMINLLPIVEPGAIPPPLVTSPISPTSPSSRRRCCRRLCRRRHHRRRSRIPRRPLPTRTRQQRRDTRKRRLRPALLIK